MAIETAYRIALTLPQLSQPGHSAHCSTGVVAEHRGQNHQSPDFSFQAPLS
jgi:hypothetical protein